MTVTKWRTKCTCGLNRVQILLVIARENFVGATSVLNFAYGTSDIVHKLHTLDQFTAFLSVEMQWLLRIQQISL